MFRPLLLLGCIILTGNGLAQGDIVFFSESPNGNEYYDSSWGFKAGDSDLELAGPGFDKYPVETQHVYSGTHSLRIRWRSAPNAPSDDWGIAVASPGWPAHDLTQYDSITYWINAPAAIALSSLPELAIEDQNNNKSTRVSLNSFFGGVDSDSTTWQKVMIPMSAFQPGPQNCDFSRIKTIFHLQKDSANTDYVMWLDEIRAIQIGGGNLLSPPEGISAAGHDSRIDLMWTFDADPDLQGYNIYRSETPAGPYTRLNNIPHDVHVYSDFLGENSRTYYYYATAVNGSLLESSSSDTVSASSFVMNDEQLLTSVQEATFRYFYDYGHPVSGLARERKGSGNTCTSGGTGFGLMAIAVGVERGFVSRDSAAARTLKILLFLQNTASRYHGAWPHWLNGETGQTIPFSQFDDGGDLVETSYLVQGLLTIRQYYDQANSTETEIRTRATQLWEEVEWSWYRRSASSNVLYWHWSPNFGWQMNLPIRGYHEAMIVYLLAVASPTYSVPPLTYHVGWARLGAAPYLNSNSFYGYRQWVGPDYGGPLFFTQYSHLGFDPRDKADAYTNYFDNSRNISLIHRAYAIENPFQHAGYDSLVWGLTACDNPTGYGAHAPFGNDNGTIAPTAALSAMPFVPEESIASLRHFYHIYGANLWGEFGFKDAFNLSQNWWASSYLAIDQGPIIIMIENYRTQLCWNLFMSNPEIQPMLNVLGFTPTGITHAEVPPRSFELRQNFPNPFNPGTTIEFEIPIEYQKNVHLAIYDILGRLVKTFSNEDFRFSRGPGFFKIDWDGRNNSGDEVGSGIYIYRITALQFEASRKMLLVR